ncbi:MAG: DUF3466 family protein [Helicobacter sp.]|nr:DUF3466 family protein [Helicobacter sp.]
MKISLIASKALIGFSILGCIEAAAVDIQSSQDFTDNFQNNKGNWTVKTDSKIKSEGVTIKGELQDFKETINSITLTTDKKVTNEGIIGSYTASEKPYSFTINAKDGVENNVGINVGRNSSITGNTTFKQGSSLDIIGSKLDITGNVTVEDSAQSISLIGFNDRDIYILRNSLNKLSDKDYDTVIESPGATNVLRSNLNNLGDATLNIKGNFEAKGNTTFNFQNNSLIRVTTTQKDTGKAIINSQSKFSITNNYPLTSDKTLLFAQGGVDIIKNENNQNTSVLTQQNDKTWKPSEETKVDVIYEREVASYLPNPSLLNGILVDSVQVANDSYKYEIRVDEKKNNLYVKTDVDSSKINTTNIKDSKSIGNFLKTQLTTISSSEKDNLEEAKEKLEETKKNYEKISSNKTQIISNINLAIK